MVRIEIDSIIRQLSQGEMSETEFQEELRTFKKANGGNWKNISAAISASLADGNYTDSFQEEVRKLATDVCDRFGYHLEE